jgi:hypothetical protein
MNMRAEGCAGQRSIDAIAALALTLAGWPEFVAEGVPG